MIEDPEKRSSFLVPGFARFRYSVPVFHRDYTIRLLQQFVMFLARLAGFVKKNDPESIALELESAFHNFLGLPRNLVLRLDADALLHMFSVTGELDADRVVIAGLLLREEADLTRRLGSPDEAAILDERAYRLIDAGRSGSLSAELREYLTASQSEKESKKQESEGL